LIAVKEYNYELSFRYNLFYKYYLLYIYETGLPISQTLFYSK